MPLFKMKVLANKMQRKMNNINFYIRCNCLTNYIAQVNYCRCFIRITIQSDHCKISQIIFELNVITQS